MSSGKEVQMRRRHLIILGGVILGLGLALASRGAAPASEVGELKVTIHEWDVPTKGAHPHDPAVGPDGALWFTEQMANKLGQLDPKSGEFKEYSLKVANMVGRLDPRNGKIDLKKVQTANSHPYGIAINSKGFPIFCEFATNKMAKIDAQSMEITEYMLPEGVRPRRMAIDAGDLVYFTDYSEGHLGRLDMTSGAVKKIGRASC